MLSDILHHRVACTNQAAPLTAFFHTIAAKLSLLQWKFDPSNTGRVKRQRNQREATAQLFAPPDPNTSPVHLIHDSQGSPVQPLRASPEPSGGLSTHSPPPQSLPSKKSPEPPGGLMSKLQASADQLNSSAPAKSILRRISLPLPVCGQSDEQLLDQIPHAPAKQSQPSAAAKQAQRAALAMTEQLKAEEARRHTEAAHADTDWQPQTRAALPLHEQARQASQVASESPALHADPRPHQTPHTQAEDWGVPHTESARHHPDPASYALHDSNPPPHRQTALVEGPSTDKVHARVPGAKPSAMHDSVPQHRQNPAAEGAPVQTEKVCRTSPDSDAMRNSIAPEHRHHSQGADMRQDTSAALRPARAASDPALAGHAQQQQQHSPTPELEMLLAAASCLSHSPEATMARACSTPETTPVADTATIAGQMLNNALEARSSTAGHMTGLGPTGKAAEQSPSYASAAAAPASAVEQGPGAAAASPGARGVSAIKALGASAAAGPQPGFSESPKAKGTASPAVTVDGDGLSQLLRPSRSPTPGRSSPSPRAASKTASSLHHELSLQALPQPVTTKHDRAGTAHARGPAATWQVDLAQSLDSIATAGQQRSQALLDRRSPTPVLSSKADNAASRPTFTAVGTTRHELMEAGHHTQGDSRLCAC